MSGSRGRAREAVYTVGNVPAAPVAASSHEKDKEANDMETREERYAEAERLKDGGNLAAAVAYLEDVVSSDPTFDLAHSALAAWCTRLERHGDAVRHARRVCELKPLDPFSFTALSVACMRAGMIAEAEEAMARSRGLQG